MNELRDKAKKGFFVSKRSINTELPITTWLKTFKCIFKPMALYGTEVWGTQTQQDWIKWDKHPVRPIPSTVKHSKISLHFWNHIKTSGPLFLSYKSPMLSGVEPTKEFPLPTCPEAGRTVNHSGHYTTCTQRIRPDQIMMKEKYRDHWTKLTKSQNKNGNTCCSKQTVHSGNLLNHRVWYKTEENTD